MKNQLFALIGLGLLLATASAYAQTGVVKANVPFNFIVDKSELPAGQYTLQGVGLTDSAMAISNADGTAGKLTLPTTCESREPQSKTKLVFHRYGSQYFLSQIWTEGEARGKELRRSSREREVAMDYTPHNVVVVATLR
jgi:hypothetical protein